MLDLADPLIEAFFFPLLVITEVGFAVQLVCIHPIERAEQQQKENAAYQKYWQ
jgi:hypothetical protein